MGQAKKIDAHVWFVQEEEFTLKSGKFKGTPGKIITFRDLDTEKEYKLNLPLNYENSASWLRDCKKGNIIKGLNINEYGTVTWWQPYTSVTVKEVNKNEN